MNSFSKYIVEYKKQLKKGIIQKAYKGLMEYILDLKTYLKSRHTDYYVSGSIYFGYMDMTYFSFTPKEFKQRNLKIAIVFRHDIFRFEVWLGGYNKRVQKEYWMLFSGEDWNKYRVVPTTEGIDAIVEHVLVDDPDFADLDALTQKIEDGVMGFIEDVECFLSEK